MLRSLRENSVEQNAGRDTNLRDAFRSVQEHAMLVFSFAAFIRQAAKVRKTCLSDVSVRGRICSPPHWNRNIFSQPLVDTDVPADVIGDFDSGRPWRLADLVQ